MPKRTDWNDRTPQDKRNRFILQAVIICTLLAYSLFVVKRHTSLAEMGLVGLLALLVIVLASLIFPTKY